MKRYCISLIYLLFMFGNLCAQNIVKMSAVKSNDYGVSYVLPKTFIIVKADAIKITRKAGEFYEYAERYLNISNPIIKNETIYSITNLRAGTDGTPDNAKRYLVEFKNATTAPFVTLTKDGLICAINADAVFSQDKGLEDIASESNNGVLPDPNTFLSEETLRAGSKAKQAELIARQIFKLRETKSNILTGEADNMPPDGSAYQLVIEQIDQQEKALTSMFIGAETTELLSQTFRIDVPEKKNIENKIVFRFSKRLGFVDSDDLSGAPVDLSLKSVLPFEEPPLLSPKEEKEWEKKFSQGIIYNIPAKADLKIEYANKVWIKKECDIVQYGNQDVLVPKMFDNNKQPVKVIFFPDLGAIKQIIQ